VGDQQQLRDRKRDGLKPPRTARVWLALALPILVAMAVSPYLGGLAFQKGGADWALGLLAGLALSNVALVCALKLSISRKPD